jgi:Putative MetA-pathway of phenol degradation
MVKFKQFFLLFAFLFILNNNSLSQQLLSVSSTGGFTIIVPFPIVSKKGKWDIASELEFTKSGSDRITTFQTQATYGFTERLGASIFMPFFLENKSGDKYSNGLSDMVTSIEYILFNEKENQALLQVGVQFPTGSNKKNPVTGTGTFNAAFKGSAFHTSEKWFGMVDLNAFLTPTKNGRKPGNNYFFEFTCGKFFTLNENNKTSVFDANIDMSGLYTMPDTLFNANVADTGGMIIFLGPIFSWTYKNNLMISTSIQWPIAQRLFGNQTPVDYSVYIYSEFNF